MWFHVCELALLLKAGKDPRRVMLRRPIALQSRGRQIVEKVLNRALEDLADSGELAEYQMGFRRGARVHDPVMIAQTLIKTAHNRRQNMYMVFIDFEDAYTTVMHEMLLAVLASMGLHHTVISVIRRLLVVSLYAVTWYGPTWTWKLSKGLLQGGVLSCKLFNFMLEALCRKVSTKIEGFKLTEDHTIKILAWADDLCIICNSPEEVNLVTKELDTWREITGMKTNISGITKTAIASLTFPRGSTEVVASKKKFYLAQADGSRVRIPMLSPKQRYTYLGYKLSTSSDPTAHDKEGKAQIAKAAAIGKGSRLPIEQLKILSDAYVSGIAAAKCLRNETMISADIKEIPRRQAWRWLTRSDVSTPREWFYTVWSATHFYASHTASLQNYFLYVWNKPRTSIVFAAALTDLINCLLVASILVDPFHEQLPYLEHRRSILERSATGRWLLICKESKTLINAGKPMAEMRGYIKQVMPKGITPLWSDQTMATIFSDKYTLAGIHYLSDLCTENQQWLGTPGFRARHPAADILTDADITVLISTAQTAGYSPPNFRHPNAANFRTNKVYGFDQGAFIAFYFSTHGIPNFWLARIAPNQPETGHIALEYWEQEQWDGNKLKERDLYVRFLKTDIMWYENALHQRAVEAPWHRRGDGNEPLSEGVILGRVSASVSMERSKRSFLKTITDKAKDQRANRNRVMTDHHQRSIEESLRPTIPYHSTSPETLALPSLAALPQSSEWPPRWDKAVTVMLGQWGKPCEYVENTPHSEHSALKGTSADAAGVWNAETAGRDPPDMAMSKHHKIDDDKTAYVAQALERLVEEHDIGVVCWPDGSSLVNNEGQRTSAFGIYNNLLDHMVTIRLEGDAWTSYGAELAAIHRCLQAAMRDHLRVLIVSDCLSAIYSVMYYPQSNLSKAVARAFSTLIAEICIAIVHLRGAGGEVFFFKVKSHEGIFGNEAADFLAKAGIQQIYAGPRISMSDYEIEGSQVYYTTKDKEWITVPLYRHFTKSVTKVVIDHLAAANSGACSQHKDAPVLGSLMHTQRYGSMASFVCKVRGDRLRVPTRRWVNGELLYCPSCRGRRDVNLRHFLFECQCTAKCRTKAEEALRTDDSFNKQDFCERATITRMLREPRHQPITAQQAAVALMGGVDYGLQPDTNGQTHPVPKEVQQLHLKVFQSIAENYYKAWRVYKAELYGHPLNKRP
jgi:ribonuclease HI